MKFKILLIIGMLCLVSRAEMVSSHVDSIQRIIDSITIDLESSLKKSNVSLISILPRDSMYIPREMYYFRFLINCRLEPIETIREIIRKQILIFQLQENMLSSVMVRRSDTECITLLKNIRVLRKSKEHLLGFQSKENLWSIDSCK